MRRLFWTGLGVGFGAAAAVSTMRWASRTRQALRPASVAERAAAAGVVWRDRLASALEAGRTAMADRERELRARYGVDGEAP
ncbi:MAG TPA: hypothetical protein VKG45_16335 [Actinomycetes bacterium]|nr:hypothetical protein [Actinomycetes bacterium]